MTWIPFLMERKRRMKINKKLTMSQYMNLTNQLFDGYFDINGEYSPTLGDLIALRKFYETCVEEYKLMADPNDVEAVMNELMSNKEILRSFEESYYGVASEEDLFGFGHALDNAKCMVQNKLNHPVSKMDELFESLIAISKLIEQKVTDSDIKTLADEIKNFDFSKVNAKAIVDAYGNSERFSQNTNDVVDAKNKLIKRLQNENLALRKKVNQKESQKHSARNVLS